MLRFITIGATFLEAYPERNPFDSDPPIWNLSPPPLYVESFDTQALRDAARAAAESSGVNPFYGAYGSCPLTVCDNDLQKKDIPFTGYTVPPPLQRAVLSAPLEFLEAVNPNGNTVLFKVQVGTDVRLLKVFRNQEVSMHGYRKPEERPPHPLKRFAKEKEAYEHLLHYGACEKGVVPHCYGWLDLSEEDHNNLVKVPGLSSTWSCWNLVKVPGLSSTWSCWNLRNDDGLPKALLLEYFDNAKQFTIDNITPNIADTAVRALYHVHASYVRHNDIHGRNVLVLPDERVVWIDFDAATTVNRSTKLRLVRRQELLRELVVSWELFYNTMLMDKRIGFRHWLY